MGVSGSGKSTVARALAESFHFEFCEADDYHGPENRARMAAGQPLTDAMREPWVERLCAALDAVRVDGRSCVIAWSALRQSHRQRIRALGFRTLFLHLQADAGVIGGRLQARPGHFFDPGLLHSQFEALQPPTAEPDVLPLDVSGGFAEVLAAAERAARDFLQAPAREQATP
jgi:gluconokinase